MNALQMSEMSLREERKRKKTEFFLKKTETLNL